MTAGVKPRSEHPGDRAYSAGITPACNREAGAAATELLAEVGSIRVTTTPTAKATTRTRTKSGLLFTVHLHS